MTVIPRGRGCAGIHGEEWVLGHDEWPEVSGACKR